jgi:hypothetical protein
MKKKAVPGKPLNLRDFPTELYWKLKEISARKHMSMKQFLILIVEEAIKKES